VGDIAASTGSRVERVAYWKRMNILNENFDFHTRKLKKREFLKRITSVKDGHFYYWPLAPKG
jgi:hypothetical protein